MKFNYYDAIHRVERPALSVTWISLLTEDEEMVSQLGLREYQMRFGSAQLKMGGIDGVGTPEEHRNKGYSRRVMEHTIEYMNENEYDVSMLFGIPNFYYKFGYALQGTRGTENLSVQTVSVQGKQGLPLAVFARQHRSALGVPTRKHPISGLDAITGS